MRKSSRKFSKKNIKMWSPLVFKGELKNQKVASGAGVFFQSKGGLKHRREAEFPEGWQLLAVQKIQLLKFIWALSSLAIFLIYLYIW